MSAPNAVAGDMDDLLALQRELHQLEQDSQRGPRILADAYKAWRDAEHTFEIAKARAHMKAKGSPDGKRPTVADLDAEVVLNTIPERTAAEAAEGAHRYAASRIREIENRRSSLQTRTKLLLEQMRLVGTGMTP
jgi:hypothetical protein